MFMKSGPRVIQLHMKLSNLKIFRLGQILSFQQGKLKTVVIDVKQDIPDNSKWHLDPHGCLVNQQYRMAVNYSDSVRRCRLDSYGNKFEFRDTKSDLIDEAIGINLDKVRERWDRE